jgi:Family of unknown function (DUF5686)/CarboxypepD_reg-like domain
MEKSYLPGKCIRKAARYSVIATLFIHHMVLAQTSLQGTVIDATTYEPMAFVNIQVKGTTSGTSTNIDGKYTLTVPSVDAAQLIEFSFVGYGKVSYTVDELSRIRTIKLKSMTTELQEVTISPGDNPAHRLVRKAIAAKPLHDPTQLRSYSFSCYNKTIYTALGLDNDSIQQDSSVEKSLRYGHLMVLESYTQIKRMRPNFTKEVVLKSKISGLKDPKLAMLSSSFQPFAFYDEQVNLFGVPYINPLSQGSLKRYEFYLVDTLYAGIDTTYVISFEPFRNIEFKTLKGLLYITSDRYAIENVIAYPADTTMKIDFRIQQQYQRIEGHWFPKELYTRYFVKSGGILIPNDSLKNRKNTNAKNLKNTGRVVPLVLKNQSYFSNIRINPPLNKKEFNLVNVDFRTDALKETDWSALRPDSLSVREAQTYYNYDTLNEKTKRLINRTVEVAMDLAGGTFPIGKVSILPNHLLRLNRYEKVALGMGLSTNEKFSKVLQLQAYGMYGFGDRALKYGGSLHIHTNRERGSMLSFRYSQDIAEPGTVNYLKPTGIDLTSGGDVLRKFLTSRMDSVLRFSIDYSFRPVRFTQISIFSSRERRNPAYAYSYTEDNFSGGETFTVSEVGLNFRFLFKESITNIAGLQVITGSSFPYITARISKAFMDVAGGQYDFVKADLRMKHSVSTIVLGKTTLYLTLSSVSGDRIPYSYLNFSNAFQFDNTNLSVYAPGYFQTMKLYEFVSDTYGQLTLEQNFGPLFTAFKGKCQPELVIVQNMAYGSLRNKPAHQSVEIHTLEKGYYESGLLINNLLRVNSKLYWLGYGIGVFYRYGPYALPDQKDNLAFTLSTSIKF